MTLRLRQRTLTEDVFIGRDNRFGVLFRNRHRVTGLYEAVDLSGITRVVITAVADDGTETLVVDTTDLDGPVVEIPQLASTDPDEEGWMYLGLGGQGLAAGQYTARVSAYQGAGDVPTELVHENAEHQRLVLNVWPT